MQAYYENEYGKLYMGDCLEIMPELPALHGPFDMVLCDPVP